MPRIASAEAPYPPHIAAELARIMPKGVEPLVLFRTLARNPRVFERMFAGGLLDKGALTLRQREIVIDRTTARLGCEYEWGVHIAFFATKAGLDPEQVAATVTGPADAACWTADEQALLSAADDLVDLYRALAGEHDDWDEYRAAMVEQRRLVLRVHVERVYGLSG